MEQHCLYCGAAFTAKRPSKKYCNDNCKQAAYFHRTKPEGTIQVRQAGTPTLENILLADIRAKIGQLMSLKPDNVMSDQKNIILIVIPDNSGTVP